ncbi:hypothetical protein MPTK1_6g19910 [Marchantia polymorpha subsp. ruderalis]|uniref:Uncharacterized protein n=2 Tax=Marchantia polymorpha TaxID=3197 RepID=A0AAF6BTZ3_MARPO|nr:hypothetical protein MARPO_0045s0072 [Marchantia polymorpha]BBN15477.1 hypothetical protein Mp_6g19910 [Marchantia polymorpha subsp. ruderalis]|eukprot:PTQ39411.1 hypothetical protein MARPO_0045s0072 [Marchantia polymorpha]
MYPVLKYIPMPELPHKSIKSRTLICKMQCGRPVLTNSRGCLLGAEIKGFHYKLDSPFLQSTHALSCMKYDNLYHPVIFLGQLQFTLR